MSDGEISSKETIEKNRNLFLQRQSATEIQSSIKQINHVIDSTVASQLNMEQSFIVNSTTSFLTMEKISTSSLNDRLFGSDINKTTSTINNSSTNVLIRVSWSRFSFKSQSNRFLLFSLFVYSSHRLEHCHHSVIPKYLQIPTCHGLSHCQYLILMEQRLVYTQQTNKRLKSAFLAIQIYWYRTCRSRTLHWSIIEHSSIFIMSI